MIEQHLAVRRARAHAREGVQRRSQAPIERLDAYVTRHLCQSLFPFLKGKTIELGGPQQLSFNEIVAIVARTMGKRRLKLHLPVWLMLITTWAMQVLPRPPITLDQLRLLPIRNVAELDSVADNFFLSVFHAKGFAGSFQGIAHIG